MNVYDVGDLVRVTGAFTNSAGTALDPAVVKFKFTNPAGVTTTYTFGTDAQLVKDSTGNYHVDLDASVKGTFRYRWFSTGNGQAAGEHKFFVKTSAF